MTAPLPPPPPTPEPPPPQRQRNDAVGWAFKGVPIAVLGGLAWFGTNNAAHECSSGLVYALDQQQCSTYSTIHTLGGVGFILGVVFCIVAMVRAGAK